MPGQALRRAADDHAVERHDLTDDHQLVYVNNVLKGKLLESPELVTQAKNNTKAQFAASPTLETQLLSAIMDALSAHQAMSKQALGSSRVREGLKDILLGPGQLYEALREVALGLAATGFGGGRVAHFIALAGRAVVIARLALAMYRAARTAPPPT